MKQPTTILHKVILASLSALLIITWVIDYMRAPGGVVSLLAWDLPAKLTIGVFMPPVLAGMGAFAAICVPWGPISCGTLDQRVIHLIAGVGLLIASLLLIEGCWTLMSQQNYNMQVPIVLGYLLAFMQLYRKASNKSIQVPRYSSDHDAGRWMKGDK